MTAPGKLFSILSIEEAENFDTKLLRFEGSHWRMPKTQLSLRDAYKAFEDDANATRLNASFFDLRLAFSMAYSEVYGFGPTWLEYLLPERVDGAGVFHSEEEFESKLISYKHQTAFVLRCRALLDKLMGFLVLLKQPSKYDSFVSEKSRRRSFLAISSQLEIATEVIESIKSSIDVIDRFRTPEAHSSGTLRKYVFQVAALDSEHRDTLLKEWSEVTKVMNLLPSIIDDWRVKKSITDIRN